MAPVRHQTTGKFSTLSKKTSSAAYKRLRELIAKAADVFRPPERMTPSEAAEEYRYVYQPGAYVGKWFNATTPYMVEPMDEFISTSYQGLVFVGPAQSAKTDSLVVNEIAYTVKIDPMDTLLFCPSQAAARDFSARRIDRLHRHSEKIGELLIKRKDADNKFDKHYVTGMILTLSWPSVTELAGRPVGRVIFTDYDRMPDDIDGEGMPYDLGSKRTQTFGSFAMTLAESSPSRPVTDPKWIRNTPHEAPPTEGILKLYNRGDRRLLYWPCPHCGSYFVGRFEHLKWDTTIKNPLGAAETVRMECPKCHEMIHPDERKGMLAKSRWLKDGQAIDKDGVIHGEGPRTKIASFWLFGTAAAFQTWAGLVLIFINAEAEYERTGSEDALTKFYNNDLGMPYLPKSFESERLPEMLKLRAEDWGSTPEDPTVPEEVRFLVAAVDVQKNAFVVQVLGIAPGEPFDITVIDRFKIYKSNREDDDGDTLWVKPGVYLEDWDQIEKQVMDRSYPLAEDDSRRMMVKLTVCDSGGAAGVTTRAYDFVRVLRTRGKAARFHLLKGDSTPNAPRTRISHVDSPVKGTRAMLTGEIPLLLLSPNKLKDELSNRLDSLIPGRGMIRFPDWLPDWFYAELCAESRTEKGWVNPGGHRNEGWDLLYYGIGACISKLIGIENWDWTKPPAFAVPQDTNPLVFSATEKEAFAPKSSPDYDFAKLAQALA